MAMEAPPADGAVRSLLGRGSVFTIATAMQMSAVVLVTPLITRLLSPSEFGRVATAMVLLQILTYLVALGLPTAVTREYFDDGGGLSAARSLMAASVAVSFVMALAIDVTGPMWARALFSGLHYGGALRVAVWATVPMSLVLASQALLRATERAGRFVVVTAVSTAGAQLIGLATAVWVKSTAAAYMTGLAAGLVVAGLVGLCFTGADLSRVRDRRLLRNAFHIGIPTVPHAMAVYIVGVGDRVLVQRFDGLGPVARYHVAYLVGALGLTLAGALNNAWAPLIYGAGDERRWQVLADTTAALYRLAGVVVCGIALAAPIALIAIAPSGYDPRSLTPVCAVVALSLMPFVGYLAEAHPIFYLRKVWSLAWTTPMAAVVNVALNALLIPWIGLMGAAYTTVVTYIVQFLLARRVRRRIATVPWRRGAAAEAWVLAAAGGAAGALLPTQGAWLVLRGIAAAGVAVVFVARLRGLLASRQPA